VEALPQARGGQHARALLVHRADELHVLVLSDVSIGAGAVKRRESIRALVRMIRRGPDNDGGWFFCRACGCSLSFDVDLEPTALCNLCAQVAVEKLADALDRRGV